MKHKATPKKTTQSKLAVQLGVSRQLIAAHVKKGDAPALDDLAGWNAYLAQRGRIGSAPEDLRRAIAQERLEILQETKSKLRRENLIATVDCGELIPRQLVEELLWNFGGILRGALHGFEDCGQAVFNAQNPDEVRVVMGRAFQELTFASMVALRSSKELKIPDWMLKSFCNATRTAPWAEESYVTMAAFAAEYIKQHGQQNREEFLKQLDAKERWRACTDPVEKERIWHEEVLEK